MTDKIFNSLSLLLLLFCVSLPGFAEDKIKPFVLASVSAGKVSEKIPDIKTALEKNGFTIVGEYAPYEGTHLIIVSNDKLQKAGANHDRAGYIAAQRVSLTQRDNQVQVAYTYPPYMGAAYHVDVDLGDVTNALKLALGFTRLFGPAEGKTVTEIKKYHYMFGMEYFDDYLELASYSSHSSALAALEKNFKKADSGVSKVYSVAIPGTKQLLVGVAMKKFARKGVEGNKYMDDAFIMSEIDFKEIRSAAHLPYEILVTGDRIEALHARFRIAINFTDLSMMGDHSFMNIMASPDAIKQALTAVAGGEVDDEY